MILQHVMKKLMLARVLAGTIDECETRNLRRVNQNVSSKLLSCKVHVIIGKPHLMTI